MSGKQSVGVSSLIGRRVVDKSGRTMGDVADTLVDCREGRVSHLVVRSSSSVCYLPWCALSRAARPRS